MFRSRKEKNKTELKNECVIPARLNENQKETLFEEIDELVSGSWGRFDREFLKNHILNTELITVARIGNDLIGFCAVSRKKILNKIIYYIEFTIVRKDFHGLELGPKLTFLALRNIFLKNFLKIIFSHIEIMFITPNIRALAKTAKFADFVYPDPYEADHVDSRISPADDETWEMARELIKISDNPNRRLDREGLVLHGSYASMPWLIYENDKIPWHHKDSINLFAKRYIGYGRKEDKEFVVRARIGVKALLKYFFHIR